MRKQIDLDLNPAILIIILNTNDLNSRVKNQRDCQTE